MSSEVFEEKLFLLRFVFYWQDFFFFREISSSSELSVPVNNTTVKVCGLKPCFQADLTSQSA